MHYKLGISTHLKYRKFSSFNREMKYEKQVIIKHNGQTGSNAAFASNDLYTTNISIGFVPTAVQTWIQ